MSSILAASGTIGAKALYLMIIWLASAWGASVLAGRAGFGEKLGLATGLMLTFAGFLIWLVIYAAFARPGSPRAVEGFIPARKKAADVAPPNTPSA